mmetsp:Transcript_59965/g.120058  ORF Transcript_59965/g.120058 Transcript_59965/m.120058 type:complete len:88 (+) Transcript_59965:88-351(+)
MTEPSAFVVWSHHHSFDNLRRGGVTQNRQQMLRCVRLLSKGVLVALYFQKAQNMRSSLVLTNRGLAMIWINKAMQRVHNTLEAAIIW